MNVVLFGAPGAGKGTQAELICSKFHLTHISTGDLIRNAIRAESPLGKSIREQVEKGNLISDEQVVELACELIESKRSSSDSFLFDGYPRNLEQISMLEQICERYNLTEPVAVSMDVPESVLMLRITGRRICQKCKKTFNVYVNPPREEDGCGIDKCPLIQRADDTPATVRERLRVYHEKTEPVLHHYEMRGHLASINGSGTAEEVFERICKILTEQY